MKATPDFKKWGLRGSPIVGSTYVRDFCRICVEPIRVSRSALENKPWEKESSPVCQKCSGQRLSCGSWNKPVWLTDLLYHGDFYE